MPITRTDEGAHPRPGQYCPSFATQADRAKECSPCAWTESARSKLGVTTVEEVLRETAEDK